eukprot:5864029-Pyramimonas_sp.AAC.1
MSSRLCKETIGCWSRGAARGMYGTTLSEVPGIFGERHELALSAHSGTMVDRMLTVLLDIGSNINTIGLKNGTDIRT